MMRFAVLALSVFLMACAGTPSTPGNGDNDGNGNPPPGGGAPRTGTVIHDGIEYSADVRVMESFPVQLGGTVALTNRSSQSRELWFPDGCVVLMRAYRPGGSEPVWDQATEMACTMAIVPLQLAPGESHQYQAPTASAYDILGDELPDGSYRITLYLRPENGEVEVEGGTTELAVPR